MRKKQIILFIVPILFSMCTKKLLDSNKSSGFKSAEMYAEKIALQHFEALQKVDSLGLYDFCIRGLKEREDLKIADLENIGCSVQPLIGYSLNWAKLIVAPKIDRIEDFIQNDSINQVFLSKEGGKILGDIAARNENGKWRIVSRSAEKPGEDSPFDKALEQAQEITKDVFILTYTPPKYKFNRYVIGYKEKGKIKIISFSYGNIQKFDDINTWFREGKVMQYK